MSNETSPLKPMGTQDPAVDAGRAASTAASKVGDAASWAVGKAKDTLRSAADQARDRAHAAVASRVQQDPLRAVLIAAGAGALLMAMLASLARSGARTVRRRVRG